MIMYHDAMLFLLFGTYFLTEWVSISILYKKINFKGKFSIQIKHVYFLMFMIIDYLV